MQAKPVPRPSQRARRAIKQRPILEIAGLRKTFGRRLVLEDVALAGAPGDLVVVTGDSGAGKSTLLRLIHGEVRPDRGQLWVDGHPLHRRWLRGAESVRRDTGFIFQDHRLLPRLNAFENVVYGVQVSHPEVPFGAIRRAAHEALEAVGLAAAKKQYPEHLSVGERQRVAVARALAGQPRLILADEPTASQDERSADRVLELLRAAAAGGALVVIASHQLDLRGTRLISLPHLGSIERPSRLRAVRLPRRKRPAGP